MGGRLLVPWRALLLMALALALPTAEGRFVVEKNSLRMTSPAGLRGVYECAIGNFGMPQYGGLPVTTPGSDSDLRAPGSDSDLRLHDTKKP